MISKDDPKETPILSNRISSTEVFALNILAGYLAYQLNSFVYGYTWTQEGISYTNLLINMLKLHIRCQLLSTEDSNARELL